jgi:hypothetical protein
MLAGMYSIMVMAVVILRIRQSVDMTNSWPLVNAELITR